MLWPCTVSASGPPWRRPAAGMVETPKTRGNPAGPGRARGNVAKAFKNGLKGITGFLEPAERELLRSLIGDVISMLQPADDTSQDPLAALIGLDMDVQEPTDRA